MCRLGRLRDMDKDVSKVMGSSVSDARTAVDSLKKLVLTASMCQEKKQVRDLLEKALAMSECRHEGLS